MPTLITVLGSGSSGNCTYVETEETRILVDAGLSGRQIRQRLLSIGRTPENLDGILLTHEHSDHTQGLVGLAAKVNVPVYCNRLTKEALTESLQARLDFRLFTTGARFDLGGITVESFSVPHDAYDPVGFLLESNSGSIGILTDLGHPTRLAMQRVRSANALILEANYDRQLLQEDTRRPWATKQRIMSRHGHLSNDSAARFAAEIVTDSLQHIFLAHLSSDCNRPDLACDAVGRTLQETGARHVSLHPASQKDPSPTFTLNATVEPLPRPTLDGCWSSGVLE